MKVIRITEIKKGFLLYMEDGSEIKLSEEIYFKEAIYEKEEIPPYVIRKLIFMEAVFQAGILCKRNLAGGLKSKRRLLLYMENKGIEVDIANKVVDNLEKEKYLNDKKFAKKKVKRKMGNNPVSKAMLIDYLENEGIERKIAESVVKIAGIDDNITARTLVEKKFGTRTSYGEKAIRYLALKGFDEDTISRVLNTEELWNM